MLEIGKNKAAPGWLVGPWDRLLASDPGLSRLRMAFSGAAAMASALAIELGFATVVGGSTMNTLVAMLLGSIVSMMGSMALAHQGLWSKVRIAAGFPVAITAGLLCGIAVASRTDLMLAIFVVVMFVAVFVRRFGLAYFFYGFMSWMGYFFASFLHATFGMLPFLIGAVAVSTAWVLLLSATVLRTNPTRTLRRTVNAFDARARGVIRACADLLADPGDDGRTRLRRRLHRQQEQLNEAALIVEGWSAEPGALPPDQSGATLRRRLIDAQHLLDTVATAAGALADGPTGLSVPAGRIALLLARRDDARATAAAQDLAGQTAATADQEFQLEARRFAGAVIAFAALVQEARRPRPIADADTGDVDEFEPVVGLAMGNLPGSAAVAIGVPARGGRWNPLARLNLTTRQAIQVALAGALAIVAGRALSPTRYYWAVIAAFVMFTGTATRGETFLKGLNRTLGTLAGLAAAIGLAELTAGQTDWVLVVIVASMFCGFYLIRLSYAYMIFFITIMVAQLYSVLHEFTAGLLVLRLEETAIGAAVGFAVALLVVPLSTRDTVRTERSNLLGAVADLLDAAAEELACPGSRHTPADAAQPTADALSRTIDDRLRRLALVARPLTRPLIGGSPITTRHWLTLYAALSTHCRALTVALRSRRQSDQQPAQACRDLAAAARELAETPAGQPRPRLAAALAAADAELFAGPSAPDGPLTQPLRRLLSLIRELAQIPHSGSGKEQTHALTTSQDGAVIADRAAG